MYIGEVLTNSYFDTNSSDSVGLALEKMVDLHTPQLPVVNEGEFLGLINERELLSEHDDRRQLADLRISLASLFRYAHQHIFEAFQYMSAHELQLLPVLDNDNDYLGVVTLNDLTREVNRLMGNEGVGAIIVLEFQRNDISFSHLTHLIESEDTKIVSMSSYEVPDSSITEVTIRVNKQNIATLVASFWRFDYVVKATFNDGNPENDMKDRYDILMNYLNI